MDDSSVDYVKKHKKELIEKYASLKEYPASTNPVTIFMAGSPGAGKTEFSKSLIQLLHEVDPETRIVRIDPDEIRSDIPGYDGHNSSLVQHGCLVGARNIFYSVLHNSQNFVYDGTFGSYSTARVGVFYIYQDPEIAWEFTKKREKIEGRPVPKDVFIKAFFNSRENVNKIKAEFGSKIMLYFVEKDFQNKAKKYRMNIDKVESFVKNEYNPGLLNSLLREGL